MMKTLVAKRLCPRPQGNFREDNFSAAMAGLANPSDTARKMRGPGGKPGAKEGGGVYKLIKMVMERNLAPVIVFSFSKKECEAFALQMAKLDFNSGGG